MISRCNHHSGENTDIIKGEVQAIGFESKPKDGAGEPCKINWLEKERRKRTRAGYHQDGVNPAVVLAGLWQAGKKRTGKKGAGIGSVLVPILIALAYIFTLICLAALIALLHFFQFFFNSQSYLL